MMIDIGPNFIQHHPQLWSGPTDQVHSLRNFMLKFYVKVFKISVSKHLNNLNYVWYDDRYWSKNVFSTIYSPGHDLQVKITD